MCDPWRCHQCCVYCPDAYRYIEHLCSLDHQQCSGDNPYVCMVCFESFPRIPRKDSGSYLQHLHSRRHQKRCERIVGALFCFDCCEVFPNRRLFVRHLAGSEHRNCSDALPTNRTHQSLFEPHVVAVLEAKAKNVSSQTVAAQSKIHRVNFTPPAVPIKPAAIVQPAAAAAPSTTHRLFEYLKRLCCLQRRRRFFKPHHRPVHVSNTIYCACRSKTD